jgi:hypothetical protein
MKQNPIDVFRYIHIPPDGDKEPCWEWGGKLNKKDGRPYIRVGGIQLLAYRVVYSLVHGDIPEGQWVLHSCDNPACCNPWHLRLGTQSDNERDKYRRDRYGYPIRLIKEVWTLHERGLTQEAIASVVSTRFGIAVTQQRVSDILTFKRREEQSREIN